MFYEYASVLIFLGKRGGMGEIIIKGKGGRRGDGISYDSHNT